MDCSTVARRLRTQIGKFSGVLSTGLPKTARRFVGEMLYGMQAKQSVVLTQVARALEEDISTKKVHERLCRQLGRPGLGETIQGNLLRHAAPLIKQDTLLIIDPSDLMKKYARKMEYLARVHDGSAGEIANGYWLCEIVGADLSGERIIPLVQHLYSAEAPDFVSENRMLISLMDRVANAVDKRGIWVMDRGGDRRKLFIPLLERKRRFVVRLRGDRFLVHGRTELAVLDIAALCPCPYAETIVKVRDGKEKVIHLEFGFRPVQLPGRKERLGLVVVRGFGKDPMMLLTTEPLRKNRKLLWRMVRTYMRRWAIEDTIRFIKQSYDVEDVRILSYRSLQNLMPLVLAASYFAAVVLDTQAKLRIMASHVIKAAKRIFGVPDFHYYAIADGMSALFQRHPGPLTPRITTNPLQAGLFPAGP